MGLGLGDKSTGGVGGPGGLTEVEAWWGLL